MKFRWNVSGTYQQALPRYVSVDEAGEEHDFLTEAIPDPRRVLLLCFRKGYQWPFDAAKAGESSLVDLLVHREIFGRGRRVYLDFRRNPAGLEDGFDLLPEEARDYLANSGALLDTPVERLAAMNPGALALYAAHQIDLKAEMLEISVCAQHCSGGLEVDRNWQTTVPGLYAAGEAAGTFGAVRPRRQRAELHTGGARCARRSTLRAACAPGSGSPRRKRRIWPCAKRTICSRGCAPCRRRAAAALCANSGSASSAR